jgi:hypothetical protein
MILDRLQTKLDFIHLNINKKQGKLRQTLRQEVADADPACKIYHDPGSLCEAVLMAFSKSLDQLVRLDRESREWAKFANFLGYIRVIRKFAAFALSILRL